MSDDMDRLVREVSRVADNLASFSVICTIVLACAATFVIGLLLAMIGCVS